MGSREQNFYNQLARRMGFEAEAQQVQDLYLGTGSTERPWPPYRFDFIDQTSLLGPPERIAGAAARVRRGGRDHADRHVVRSRPRGETFDTSARCGGAGGKRSSRLTPVDFFQAVILGIVEGITEFLPVSSTGHLTITEKILGLAIDDTAVTAFTAVIQVGAITAVILYFRKDIWNIAVGLGAGTRQRRGRAGRSTTGWAGTSSSARSRWSLPPWRARTDFFFTLKSYTLYETK